MNQVKIIHGNACNSSSVAMHRNKNVVTATKLPSPAVLEVIILTTGSTGSYHFDNLSNFIAERGKYRLSLFITPSVRDILLAIFSCVWVPVIILTTSSSASNKNLRNCRFCAWAIWKHGHVDHPMSMLADGVVIATTLATVSDQRVATAPRSPNHRFFAFNCCYKYSNRFHHSRNYINQSSNIWYGGKQSINYAS